MSSPRERLRALEAREPEWLPWLSVIAAVQEEIDAPGWDQAVPGEITRRPRTPLLAGARVSLGADDAARAYRNIMDSARALPGYAPVSEAPADVRAVFEAALNRDSEALAAARDRSFEPALYEAIATLLPMPWLHACARRWGVEAARGWSGGYCPVCGAWPAYAEVRGIERTRHLRCAPCGADWRAHALSCVYCGNTDHTSLGSLVAETGESGRTIDVCRQCSGYLKVYTVLSATAPAAVMLEELATAELDVAALERGYKRPHGAAHPLAVTLSYE